MLNIGCHLSASKGFMNMGLETTRIGGNTFQFFTRNPRGSQAKDIDLQDISSFLAYADTNGFVFPLAHAPYTLNPAAADPKVREFAELVLADDLVRLSHLPGVMYNIHPGSHVGQGVLQGIDFISEILNKIISPDQSNLILLETMSGKGSEVGSRFEELKAIRDNLNYPDRVGVCLDTCHVFSAGYDIVHNLNQVIDNFDKVVGISNLKAIHLNDSLKPFNEHKDRHAPIGFGAIGAEAFARIINHPALRHLPFYLETPHEDLSGYAEEIAMLKGLYQA